MHKKIKRHLLKFEKTFDLFMLGAFGGVKLTLKNVFDKSTKDLMLTDDARTNTKCEIQLDGPDVVHLVLFGESPNRSLHTDVDSIILQKVMNCCTWKYLSS